MKKLLCIVLTLLMAMTMTVAFAEANTELSGTIRIIGPGMLNGPGAEGAEDLITGQFKPGYLKMIEEFNEDYPNIKIEFTETPWDNWKAVLQTAAAGGTADILLHGSMLTDIAMDLTPYLEATPEIYDYMTTGPEEYRDPADYTKTIPTGLSYCVDPYYAVLDKKLFEDWGVELPAYDWTWDDMLDLASKLTGTNPVTGEENYGVYVFSLHENNAWKAPSSYFASKGIDNHHFDDSADKFGATPTYDSEEVVAALTYFNELNKYQPAAYIEDMGAEEWLKPTNNIAIRLTEGMPGAYSQTLFYETVDRYVYMPLPANEDQSDAMSSSFTGTNSIAISKNAAEPDLAWEFIKWLIMDDDAQQWLADGFYCASTKKAVELMKEKQYPYAECYDYIMSNFWDCYSVEQYDALDISYGNMQSIWLGNFSEMLAGSMTPEEAAQAIQAGLIEYMDMNR